MFAYTSGTTGEPKAAMLQHSGFVAMQSQHRAGRHPQTWEDCAISYLPYAHTYEQNVFIRSMIVGFSHGYYSGDPLLLFDDLKALKPTLMAIVPRILSKVYQKVEENLKHQRVYAQWLFHKAVNDKIYNIENKAEYTHWFYDKYVFKGIRDIFGGNLKSMITGSAALDPKIMMFFKASLGIPIN